MKATDFRINNWVYSTTHQQNYKIIRLEKDSELINIEPIELTEEWLLKFSFAKDNQNNYRKYDDETCGVLGIVEHKKLYTNEHLSFFFNVGGSYAISSIDFQIKYVHQLQNLYFALCGSELTIKE